MMPDPVDSQIPGSRRMSTIQRPSTTAPLAPTPSKKPFIKQDPNPPEAEEDTEVLLERVKAKIEDLRRRQSIGLGPPPLERQRSQSPTKQDAEALFWGSDRITSTRIDQFGDKDDEDVGHSYPRSESDDMDDDEEAEEQEVIRQTTPVKSWNPSKTKLPPKTPKMDGIKGLFAGPKAAQSTPAMGGIKQLFNEAAKPHTPVYVGVRDMFKTTVPPAEQDTSALEGVGDLLSSPIAHREQQSQPEPAEVSTETTVTDPEIIIPGTKAAAAVRRRGVATEAKRPVEESLPPTTNTTQPLKIGRPKKALKVNYSDNSALSCR